MEILEKAGGLHKFMNWDRNILTDSGGYKCTPFRLTENQGRRGEVQIAWFVPLFTQRM
jgi:tRNA-guanine family transglycosylase